MLNTLQMWAKSSDRMTYMDVKGRMGGIEKDKTLRCVGVAMFVGKATVLVCTARKHPRPLPPQKNSITTQQIPTLPITDSVSAFDACRQLLCEARSVPFFDRYNAFFVDYSLMPLLVAQNYLDAVK